MRKMQGVEDDCSDQLASSANLSCLLTSVKLPCDQRVCNPYIDGIFRASMFRMNHQHVQAARLLTHTYGATIPAEACVSEEHWIAEHDLGRLNQVEAAVASMSHTARAGKVFPIMITKVPCTAWGCCALPYEIRTNSTDLLSAINFFVKGEYRILLDLQGLKPKHILDVGGVGMSAIWLALLYPDAVIYRLDPHPDNFLAGAYNGWGVSNVRQVNIGLWDKTTVLQMCDRTDINWGTGWPFAGSQQQAWYAREPEDPPCAKVAVDGVHVTTLSKIMDMYSIPSFDIIKADMEGAELQVFRHHDTIAIMKQVSVFIGELHNRFVPGSGDKVVEMFEKLGGYRYFHDDENDVWISNKIFQAGCDWENT